MKNRDIHDGSVTPTTARFKFYNAMIQASLYDIENNDITHSLGKIINKVCELKFILKLESQMCQKRAFVFIILNLLSLWRNEEIYFHPPSPFDGIRIFSSYKQLIIQRINKYIYIYIRYIRRLTCANLYTHACERETKSVAAWYAAQRPAWLTPPSCE